MKQLVAAKVVTGPTAVTYLALVDEIGCNASAQVSEGAQKTTKEAAASAKAELKAVVAEIETGVSDAHYYGFFVSGFGCWLSGLGVAFWSLFLSLAPLAFMLVLLRGDLNCLCCCLTLTLTSTPT